MLPRGCAVRFTLLAGTAPPQAHSPQARPGSREAGRTPAWLPTAPPRPETGRRLVTGTGGPGSPTADPQLT